MGGGGGDWSDAATSRGPLGAAGAGRDQDGFSPRLRSERGSVTPRLWECALRTVREHILVCWATRLWAFVLVSLGNRRTSSARPCERPESANRRASRGERRRGRAGNGKRDRKPGGGTSGGRRPRLNVRTSERQKGT